MGYSCTAAASYVMDAITALMERTLPKGSSSNALDASGSFWERGRENADGAMTGPVFRALPEKPGYVRRCGSYRISPEGKIERFPMLPKTYWPALEAGGAATYRRIHGPFEAK